MSDWINKKSAQLHDARKEQEHRREILPAKAADMWQSLRALIYEDVRQMNTDGEIASRLKGELTTAQSDNEIVVRKQSLPSMELRVTFNRSAATLRGERHTKRTPNANDQREPLPHVRFELDSQDNVVLVDEKSGEPTTFEKLSELWLSPFISE